MKIGIIGSGVVGQATGKSLADFNEITFNDINHKTLRQLHHDGFKVADNTPLLVEQSDIVLICVNTPTHQDGEQDLSQIDSVIPQLIQGIEYSDNNTSIIFRSTILPTKIKQIIDFMKKNIHGKEYQKDWNFFYNPEFLLAENPLETLGIPTEL